MIRKIIDWIKNLFEPRKNYYPLYMEELKKRQDVEQCLTTLKAQIRASLKESDCKEFDGKGI